MFSFVSTSRLISFVLFFLLVVIWMVNADDASNAANNTPKETNTTTPATTKTPSQLPAPTGTPQIDTLPMQTGETTLSDDLKKLIDIDEETLAMLKAQENSTWSIKFDKVIDSSLAATLAGLALAAAAFLLSLEQAIHNKVKENKASISSIDMASVKKAAGQNVVDILNNVFDNEENNERRDATEKAAKHMIKSFFGFIVVLVASLTIDTQTEGVNGWTWQFTLDLTLSFSGMSLGILHMVRGALKLLYITKESMEENTRGDKKEIDTSARAAQTESPSSAGETALGVEKKKPTTLRRMWNALINIF